MTYFKKNGKRSIRRGGKRRGIAGMVKQLIRKQSEVKRIDSTSTAGISSGGTLTQLSNIAQGTADSERIGNRVRARSLYMSGIITGADTTNFVRIMLVRSNSRELVIGDMPNTYSIPDNELMTVLYDRGFNLNNIGDFDIYQKSVKIARRLNNMQVHWDSAGNAVKGHHYLYLVSDSVAVTHPTFSYDLAYYFYDT